MTGERFAVNDMVTPLEPMDVPMPTVGPAESATLHPGARYGVVGVDGATIRLDGYGWWFHADRFQTWQPGMSRRQNPVPAARPGLPDAQDAPFTDEDAHPRSSTAPAHRRFPANLDGSPTRSEASPTGTDTDQGRQDASLPDPGPDLRSSTDTPAEGTTGHTDGPPGLPGADLTFGAVAGTDPPGRGMYSGPVVPGGPWLPHSPTTGGPGWARLESGEIEMGALVSGPDGPRWITGDELRERFPVFAEEFDAVAFTEGLAVGLDTPAEVLAGPAGVNHWSSALPRHRHRPTRPTWAGLTLTACSHDSITRNRTGGLACVDCSEPVSIDRRTPCPHEWLQPSASSDPSRCVSCGEIVVWDDADGYVLAVPPRHDVPVELRVVLVPATQLDEMFELLVDVRARLARLERQEHRMTAAITDIDAEVDQLDNDLTTLSGGLSQEASLLAAQHAELLAAIEANDPAAVQAVADKLAASVKTVQDLSTAVDAAIAASPDPAAAPAPTGDPTIPVSEETPPGQETIPSTPDGGPAQPAEDGTPASATGTVASEPTAGVTTDAGPGPQPGEAGAGGVPV